MYESINKMCIRDVYITINFNYVIVILRMNNNKEFKHFSR